MDISKLNQRILIQKGNTQTDDVGTVLRQWQDFYSCFASIKTTGGKERQVIQRSSTPYPLLFVFANSFQRFLLWITALCSVVKPTTYFKSALQTMTAKQ